MSFAAISYNFSNERNPTRARRRSFNGIHLQEIAV